MFTERFDELFQKIGLASYGEFARIMGCESAYISMLRKGKRTPAPGSPSAGRLARAFCDAAAETGRVEELRDLVRSTAGADEDRLAAAVELWLLEAEISSQPKARKRGRRPRYTRGEVIRLSKRLDAAMLLTGLSNAQLARVSGVDASMISRYRQGERFPDASDDAAGQISSALYRSAAAQGRLYDLAALTELSEDTLSDRMRGGAAFHDWLLNTAAEDALMEDFLSSMDDFAPGSALPSAPLSAEEAAGDAIDDAATQYRGTAGLRKAVLRFLGGAVRNGVKELWLYSDQPTGWMTSNSAFTQKWAALMVSCIRAGMRIRVIHNVDRGLEEMLSAISNWLPLYLSGQVESWYSPKPCGERFSHTMFLAPGYACIHASFPAGSERQAVYRYDTDAKLLDCHAKNFKALLSGCLPLVRISPAADTELLLSLERRNRGVDFVLPTLSLATMPEALLKRMAERAELGGATRENLFAEWKNARTLFHENLLDGYVHELFPLPSLAALRAGRVPVDSVAARLFYTPEDFSEHLRNVIALSGDYASYRLTILPEHPFASTKFVVGQKAVVILHLSPPETAFTIRHHLMRSAFASYVERLGRRNEMTRSAFLERVRLYV